MTNKSFKVSYDYEGVTKEVECKSRVDVYDMNSIVYNTAKAIFVNGEYMPGLKDFIFRHSIVKYFTGIDLLPIERETADGEFAAAYDFLIFSDLFNNIVPADDDLQDWEEEQCVPEDKIHPGQYLSMLKALDEQIEARVRQSKWDDVADKLSALVSNIEEICGNLDIKEVVDTLGKLSNMTSDDMVSAVLKREELN